jgi:NCAIR mutase (PurE)-related protein
MKRWISTLSNSYKILNDFQTMNTLLSYTHGNSSQKKIEPINMIETINYLSNIITMSSTNHEFDVDLSYETGIPEVVYGNMTIFKQIMSILLTLGHKNANAVNSTS